MPIVWRNEMSIGNDLIDQDHKYLLCIFNSIELACRMKKKMNLYPSFLRSYLNTQRFILTEKSEYS